MTGTFECNSINSRIPMGHEGVKLKYFNLFSLDKNCYQIQLTSPMRLCKNTNFTRITRQNDVIKLQKI